MTINISPFGYRHPIMALIIFWLIIPPAFIFAELPYAIFKELIWAWKNLSLIDELEYVLKKVWEMNSLLIDNIRSKKGVSQ